MKRTKCAVSVRRLACVLAAAALVQAAPAEEPERVRPPLSPDEDLLEQLIQRDMFYGADDYFGHDRDISYVDAVRPTPATETSDDDSGDTTVSTSRDGGSGDRDSGDGSSGGSSGGGGGADDGGGGEDVGEEETEPDVPDDPGDDGGGG